MSTYKLYYFNGRGRAEVSRLILAVAGQKYEDVRYEQAEWPSHKAEMPLGQIPVLEFEGKKLPQSLTIARFLAKQFNLAGKNNFEQAQVDAVTDTINDALSTYVFAVYVEKDETKQKELLKKYFDDDLPKYLQNLDVLSKLYGNGGPYFVGNNLTWADLFFYVVFENLLGSQSDCLDKYPWFKQNRAEVEKQPRIAEHIKNRPETPF